MGLLGLTNDGNQLGESSAVDAKQQSTEPSHLRIREGCRAEAWESALECIEGLRNLAVMGRENGPGAADIVVAAADKAESWYRAHPTADIAAVKRELQRFNVAMTPALLVIMDTGASQPCS